MTYLVFNLSFLFMYLKDIPEIVNCSIKMFADDTKYPKLFRTVKSII